jgi:hypothetical protein
MKEIISAVLVVVGLWGGTRALANYYDTVRKAALEKASEGLPSLVQMNHKLHRPAKAAPSDR